MHDKEPAKVANSPGISPFYAKGPQQRTADGPGGLLGDSYSSGPFVGPICYIYRPPWHLFD